MKEGIERKQPLVVPYQLPRNELRRTGGENFGRFLLASHYSVIPNYFEKALGNSIATANAELDFNPGRIQDNYWKKVSEILLGVQVGNEYESYCALSYGRAISVVKNWQEIDADYKKGIDDIKQWERIHGEWLTGTSRVSKKDEQSGLYIVKQPVILSSEFDARYPLYEVALRQLSRMAQSSTRVKIAAEVHCGVSVLVEGLHQFPEMRHHHRSRQLLEGICEDSAIQYRLKNLAEAA